jgi:hypothetical protein
VFGPALGGCSVVGLSCVFSARKEIKSPLSCVSLTLVLPVTQLNAANNAKETETVQFAMSNCGLKLGPRVGDLEVISASPLHIQFFITAH